MAITTSAKKAIRSSARKNAFNAVRKDALMSATKKLKKLLKTNNIAEAETFFREVQQSIDKAAKTNYLKDNTAARKKSRLAAMIRKAKTAAK